MHFRRRLTPQTKVDLIPMIDVVFQLVVFFMVTSTFIQTPGIALTLPGSSTAESVVMNRLVITLAGEEEIYLNKERYTLETLGAALGQFEKGEREQLRSIVIEGDEGVSYALMVKVMDVLRRRGFEGVSLRTRDLAGRTEGS